MSLTDKERKHLARRARLVRLWPWLGTALLLGLIAFGAWLWMAVPLLINPWVTIDGLEAQTVPDTTLTLMAVLTPVLMLTSLGLLVAMILVTLAACANERRHIAVIERELRSHKNSTDAG